MIKRINKKLLTILLTFCLLAFILCVWLYSTIPSPDIFDELVSPGLIEYGCSDVVPFKITCTNNTFKLKYRTVFELDTKELDVFALIIITIQPAWFPSPSGGFFISPHGGGDMTSITTSDGKYDIIVEQHNHGMDGVASPTISTSKLAHELNRIYSQ